jgi:ribosomal-protein-alanine N-acetyltransferase
VSKIIYRSRLCEIRPLQFDDAPSLAYYANNRKIWRNLRDGFPHPYTLADAEQFITRVKSQKPETAFAIIHDGKAIGAIGFKIGSDVERVGAETGYWIGEPFWGQGIMTEAVKGLTDYIIKKHNLTRIFAVPFDWNTASHRVLEKAGYQIEGRMRRSVIKEGKIIDQLLYAYVPDYGDE